MQFNRVESETVRRIVAVVLSSSLTLSPTAPLFAGGFSRGEAPSVPSVPTLGAASAAPTLGATAVTLPVLQVSNPIALTPSSIARVQAAAAATPSAAATAPAAKAQPTALGAAMQLAPQAKPGQPALDLSSAKTSQDASYDGIAGAGKAAPASSVDADWTSAPPSSALSSLKPAWKAAEAPSAPALKQKASLGGLNEPVAEKDVTLTEKIVASLKPDAAKDISGDEESMSYGLRERYRAEGAKRAVLAGDAMAWIDASGSVIVRDRAERETRKIDPPLGIAEMIAASQDGKFLYIVAGGHLQRLDVAARESVAVMDDKALGGQILEMLPIRNADGKGQGLEIRTTAGTTFWDKGTFARLDTVYEAVSGGPSLREAGDGLYLESRQGGTRLWGRTLAADGAELVDLGTIPAEVKSVVALADRKTVFGLTDSGFIEWDLAGKRFRSFSVNGLRQAVSGRATIDASADGRRVLVSAGEQLFFSDLGEAPRGVEAAEAELRLWSENNPMFIKDGQLHIGDFTFAVKPRYEAVKESWLARIWRTYVTKKPAPQGKLIPPVSKDQWEALNLPSNKKALYQTLKGFTLGQNVLYIGETGGGKTWMSSMIAKLIGRKLYMVSFTEYTKNQDLLYSRTFGEEAKGKTGKTLETVLQWLDDKEGGILLLDEMHKPLEGIAALNNILQNLSYHFSGRDIVGDRKTHFVIGTMNPVKPPYKGEPPSGELSSRFGTTIQVNYLPRAEEAALLRIFFPGANEDVARTLVAIANELRKIYPDVLPLPISSRTLLYIAEHIAKFPGDDAVEIFKTTYNPGTLVEDPSIVEAIDKALKAHDLKGAGSKKA